MRYFIGYLLFCTTHLNCCLQTMHLLRHIAYQNSQRLKETYQNHMQSIQPSLAKNWYRAVRHVNNHQTAYIISGVGCCIYFLRKRLIPFGYRLRATFNPDFKQQLTAELWKAVRANEQIPTLISHLIDCGADVNSKDGEQTMLRYAARHNRVSTLVTLLDASHIRIDEVDIKGRSALFIAASNHHPNIVQILCREGANTDSTLFYASYYGKLDIVLACLTSINVNINAQDSNGKTALMHAVDQGHANIVQILLQHPHISLAITDKNKETAFAFADQSMQKLLNNKQNEVNRQLWEAVGAQQIRLVKTLIAQGASVTACNTEGETMLMAAATKGNLAITKLLIKAHAPLDAKDPNGLTALHYACYTENNEKVVTELIAAKAPVDAQDNSNNTPLMIAACFGNETIVQKLIEAGANVTLVNKNGHSAQTIARQLGHQHITELLEKSRACIHER